MELVDLLLVGWIDRVSTLGPISSPPSVAPPSDVTKGVWSRSARAVAEEEEEVEEDYERTSTRRERASE